MAGPSKTPTTQPLAVTTMPIEDEWRHERERDRALRERREAIATLPEDKLKVVWLAELIKGGSVGKACEECSISRYTAGVWARKDERIKEAIETANEVAFEGILAWLHDQGRGEIRARLEQVETQWKLFYFRNKQLAPKDGQVIDNRSYIVNIIGNPEARTALSTLNRVLLGVPRMESDAGGHGVEVQSGSVEASEASAISQ